MSHRAIGLGLEDRLRAVFNDTDGRFVFFEPGLKPPPAACSFRTTPFVVTVGQISSSPGQIQGGDASDQVFTCQVCVTAWMAYAPQDRQGVEAAGEPNADGGSTGFAAASTVVTEDGVMDCADRIAAALVKTWPTVAALNARVYGVGTTTNGFVEPFGNASIGTLDDAPPAWVGSEQKGESGVKKITITLSGLRRIRATGTY